MYCQQRLFAFLYAVLGIFSNITQDSPPLFPYEESSGQYRTECASALTSISQYITVSDIVDRDGPGCAISLASSMGLDAIPGGYNARRHTMPSLYTASAAQPVLKLTFTLANLGEGINLRQCETLLEELILEGPETNLGHMTPQIRLPLPGQLEDVSSSQAYHAKRTLWHSRQIEAEGSQSDSPTQGYHGILKYIISKMDGMGSAKRSNGDSNSLVSFTEMQSPVQRDLYSLGPTCEDRICEGYNWEDICISSPIPATKQDQCIMCYPQKHMGLVKGYCQEKRYTELDVFYKTCALLGASIMGATVLYLLREIYRRLRMRYQLLQSLCRRSQQSGSSATKAGISSIFPIDALLSGAPEGWRDPRQVYHDTGGNFEMSTATSAMIQQKFKRFGPFVKDSRRRVQEVFDLESFDASQGEPALDSRVPVLPRAPNASVRRHSNAWKTRANSYFGGEENQSDNMGEETLISFGGMS
ncbi:hypothetical protein BO71DRAFT_475263 [Aspergillus ellipticus CBS 707.79]|uniref:Integral membrane protein n=1 Tax=Aspergillus ellipticus CBS 707.79 TaxID=1448320 RepID=A0A319F396_9EURO|nr:hypothetical protein BO71DRAFT_475263 [Aspergillus ellipticus CBS 707.79]